LTQGGFTVAKRTTSEEKILGLAGMMEAAEVASVAGQLLNWVGVSRETWERFTDQLTQRDKDDLLRYAGECAEARRV
jgi:hypothetical protein